MYCDHYKNCGACSLLHLDYPAQLARKREAVVRAFAAAGLRPQVHEVAGMDEPFHYRNKVIANVSMRGGRIVCGMYEEYSHKVVGTPDCMLQDETLNAVLAAIESELNALHIRAYGFGGVLKQILLRIGVSTGQVLVVFVTSDDMFHGRGELVKRIVAAQPRIRTVIQNTNPRETSVVLGDREKVLYGPGAIYDDLLGRRYRISAKSFYQINPTQTAKLYSKALELAHIGPGDVVMDAYCGIGTIGISASGNAGEVIGVEINRDAVRDAIGNARHNSADNVRFYCDDVKKFMRNFDSHVDVLIVDPPRSGCDAEFIEAVKKLRPGRMVYVSCNPETQATDISRLSGMYSCTEAWPVDMFPHTAHIENVCLLTLRKS